MESIRRKINTSLTQPLFDIYQKTRAKYLFKLLKLIILRRNGKLGNKRGDDYAQTVITHFKKISG